MKRIRSLLIFLPLTIAMLVSACDRNMVYEEYISLEGNSWKWGDKMEYAFELNDTSTLYDILIQLRHSTSYPLSNLYMFVNVEGPSGQTMTDTLNFILAENSGKWIGKGVGNIREIGYLYRKNARFPEPGTYRVSIEQAMRLPEVPVNDVGLRVAKK